MSTYKPNRLADLENMKRIGKKIAFLKEGKTTSSSKIAFLEKLVEKVTLHCSSQVALFYHAKESNFEELDISIIASATRNIMESSNYYFHLSERKLSEEEVELRVAISYLNMYTNELRIFSKLELDQTSFRYHISEYMKNIYKEDIKYSPILKSLSNEKSNYLSGHKHYYYKNEINILPKNIESGLYDFFSNSVHSTPLGLRNNSLRSNIFFRGTIPPLLMYQLSIEISIIYSAHVFKDYLELRKKLYNLLEKEEKEFIKNMKSIENLILILKNFKMEFEKDLF